MRYLVVLLLLPMALLAQPTIPPGQVRTALSSIGPEDTVGAPLFAIASTGTLGSWTIISEDNTAAGGGVNATEFFFTVDNSGQLTANQELAPLVANGTPVQIILTMRAFDDGGGSADETVDLWVIEDVGGLEPAIPSGQTRVTSSGTVSGDSIGAVIFAANGPTSFSIVAEDNTATAGAVPATERFFDIDAGGQITASQSLASLVANVSPVSIFLDLVAYNENGASATTSVEIVVVNSGGVGGIPVVGVGQRRSLLTSAAIGAAVGDPLFASNINNPDVSPNWGWTLVSEDNTDAGVVAGLAVDDVFFNINNDGQLTVLQPLDILVTNNAQVDVILTVRAFNDFGNSLTESVTIRVVEFVGGSDTPQIITGQARGVVSSVIAGGKVGDVLFATNSPTSWSIILENNAGAGAGVGVADRYFDIDNSGQILVLQPLNPLVANTSPVEIFLTIQAYNGQGGASPEVISIFVIADPAASGPIIASSLVRSVVTTAAPGDSVGAPLFATGEPSNWAIVDEDNGVIPGIGQNDVFFEIDESGQITVLQTLTGFHPGRAQTAVTLTVEAYNDQGTGTGTVSINVVEGPKPSIPTGQTRNILTTHSPGAAVGSTLTANNNATYWYIATDPTNNFNIDNTGQLTTVAFFNPDAITTPPTQTYPLLVVAGNADGESAPTTVNINVTISASCGYIPPNQTRFVSSIAAAGTLFGDPVDIHNIDSMWVNDAWIDGGAPDPDITSSFNISDTGQLSLVRPLSAIFDPDLITRVIVRVTGHVSLGGCSDEVTQDLVVYVLPDDAVTTGGGGGGGGTTPVDISLLFTDLNLRSCVRDTLGLATDEVMTVEMALGLTHLDCLCRSNNAITNLDGLQVLSGLEFLSLANNLITDIENVAGLTELKDLRLANNLIIDIETGNPLASLVNLEVLDLSNNQIKNTNAFSTLVNISFLSLADNKACDIASLQALANLPAGGIKQGDTIILDHNHLVSTQALQQIGSIQSTGAFVSAIGQTSCTADAPIILTTWPENSVLEYTTIINTHLAPNCN